MDRAEAAVHYLSHSLDALEIVLSRCAITYKEQAAASVSRMFIDLLLGENLALYCSVDEVYALWDKYSQTAIVEKVYGGEFIIALNQQFSLAVEPPVIYPERVGDRRLDQPADYLTNLGVHLVMTLGASRPIPVAQPNRILSEDKQAYHDYLQDVPGTREVTSVLTTFPWMAPLYLLSLANPKELLGVLNPWVQRALREASAEREAGNA